MIGRGQGRAVTFVWTGVACVLRASVGGCILGSVAAKPKRMGPGIRGRGRQWEWEEGGEVTK